LAKLDNRALDSLAEKIYQGMTLNVGGLPLSHPRDVAQSIIICRNKKSVGCCNLGIGNCPHELGHLLYHTVLTYIINTHAKGIRFQIL
jgi:hypothetical protein